RWHRHSTGQLPVYHYVRVQRSVAGIEAGSGRAISFYFLFKKRQVEMTTLASRVFVPVPEPEGGGSGIRELGGQKCRWHRHRSRPLGVNGCERILAACATPLLQGFWRAPPLDSRYFNESARWLARTTSGGLCAAPRDFSIIKMEPRLS